MKIVKSLDELEAAKRYLRRIGAEIRSMRGAIVVEKVDQYSRDIIKIKFTEDGHVIVADKRYEPNSEEKQSIELEFSQVKFPHMKVLPTLVTIPEEIKDVPREDIFEFKDKDGSIIMLQVKREGKGKNGKIEKYYLPYTFWDDGEWRRVEPEDGLPLWGLDNIKDNTTVFIHEGAKAGRSVHSMISGATHQDKERFKAHPWGVELSSAAHVGWVGGALAPARTDWAALNKMGIKIAYIVSDNDKVGLSAVSEISQHLRVPTFHLQFTDEWPSGFDLADNFPEHMFKVLDEIPRYVGPAFKSCIHPATWATDIVNYPDEPPTTVLRDHFKDMWAYIEQADVFVCKAIPNIIREEKILNNMLASFAHTGNVCKLLYREYSGRTTGLCYKPDRPEQIVTDGNSASINLHIPTLVRMEQGDPSPFLDFLKYMFPIERERVGVERWMATLIARPDIRMEYGMLMISEATGIGKTTLGSLILSPLVNPYNVGFPRESDIVNDSFNDWVANKRLVIVHEIYSGQSWKAYHTLKSLITDKDISVNQKYQRPYIVENWCHIFACSNSRRALKMEGDDRRWMYPEITETRWPKEKFIKLRDWLSSGGLGMIRSWAEGYGNYVMPGERAPMTAHKRDMIEGSRSEAQLEAVSLAEAMSAYAKPIGISLKDIVYMIRANVQGKVFDSDYDIKKAMLEADVHAWKEKIRIHGRMQHVIMNSKLNELLRRTDSQDIESVLLNNLVKPNEILESEI